VSISRRKFLGASAGTAGLGAMVASIPEPLFAAEQQICPVQPEPIPHTIVTPFGTTIHFFFPGPVEGTDDNTGHDPSVITDFSGIIAQADLEMTGTGTDLATGDTAPYDFHCDMRFMNGKFVAADGRTHNGAFAFI
jgi:hypothetical protein